VGAAGSKTEAISAALDEDLDDAEELSPQLRGEVPKIRDRVVDSLGRGYGTGRRKTSVARVWVSEGSGVVSVNDRSVIDYFDQSQREHSLSVFMHTKTSGFFDVWATVKGGGKMGMLAELSISHISLANTARHANKYKQVKLGLFVSESLEPLRPTTPCCGRVSEQVLYSAALSMLCP
jgi:ribosomal protein S9